MHFPPLQVDLDFSQAVQSYQSDWLTWKMKLVSAIVTPEVILLFGLGLVVFLHFKKHDERTIVKMFLISTGYLLIPVLKNLLARPRPGPYDVDILTVATDYSFPSGHAIGVVLLAGMITLLIGRLAHHHQRWWLGMVTLFVLLVGYSRIYLGVHWLSDVLAGYVIGLLWIILVLQVQWTKNLPDTARQRSHSKD